MKKIKLEIGKTYRNRKGELVGIVGKNSAGRPPYKGSDGEWYAEDGKWQYFGAEFPEDLVEEVTTSDASQKHNEMEVLVLQVGKAYVNRKGEEVKIVGKNDKDRHPYQGSNGKMYAENGKWGFLSDKHPEDIIKEVEETQHTFAIVDEALTATRYTFDIPEGVKKVTAKQEGNRIIVEMVPEDKEPKPGDVMVNKFESVYLFKGVVSHNRHSYFAVVGRSGRTVYDSVTIPGRPATPEEAQLLWDALKKAGKRWSPEAMQVEDVPERERIMEYLQDCVHNTTWNYEQLCLVIEGYLIRKEYHK